MDSTIDMGGQQMEMVNETTHTFSIEIVDVAADGTLTADFKFVRIRGSMTLPMMGDVDFDSATPGDADEKGPGNGMVALAGKTFAIKVAKNGEVKEVKGIKEACAPVRSPLRVRLLPDSRSETPNSAGCSSSPAMRKLYC